MPGAMVGPARRGWASSTRCFSSFNAGTFMADWGFYGLLAPEVHSYLGWMTENPGIHVLSDALWAELEPLINEVRPHCKVPHDNLRQTIEAILWRHQNGAKWRAIPGELGPWWKAAQTFIRWGHLGVWERLLE